MKHTLFLALAALMIAGGSARAEQRTLVGGPEWEHGGMGALSFGGTSFNGAWVPESGSRGQWIINHKFGLGLGSYTMVDPGELAWGGNRYEMSVHYSGIDLEYSCNPDDVVHYSIYALFAGGRIEADNWRDDYQFKDDFYSILPRANVEVNVTSWFRVNGGVGYRFAQDVDIVGLDNHDLSGLQTTLTLKFGKF